MKYYLKKVPHGQWPKVCHSQRGESCFFAGQICWRDLVKPQLDCFEIVYILLKEK